jgi:hypothetical protein
MVSVIVGSSSLDPGADLGLGAEIGVTGVIGRA